MKKFKLLLVILVAFLLIPFSVFAEDTDAENDSKEEVSKEVNLYFFNGNGCGHCANAEAWFEEIEEEYGKYFNLVSYEVWYNEENSELMEAVAELRGEQVDGVPYIIIGNQSWNGFAEDYKEEILSKIKSEYEQDPATRYDIMNYEDLLFGKDSDKGYGSDILTLIIIIIVVGGITAGIIMARKKTN